MLPSNYHDWMNQLIANAHEKKYDYFIARVRNSVQYFYYDFDYIGREKTYQLFWTPAQRYAFPFDSEQEVEEFKAEYVSPRKASIIRVIKQPQMMLELTG